MRKGMPIFDRIVHNIPELDEFIQSCSKVWETQINFVSIKIMKESYLGEGSALFFRGKVLVAVLMDGMLRVNNIGDIGDFNETTI